MSSSTDAQKRYATRVNDGNEVLKNAFEEFRATHPDSYLKILSALLKKPTNELEGKLPVPSQPDKLKLAGAAVTT